MTLHDIETEIEETQRRIFLLEMKDFLTVDDSFRLADLNKKLRTLQFQAAQLTN